MSQFLYVIGYGMILFGLGGLSLQVEEALAGDTEDQFLGFMLVVSSLGMGAFTLMAASSRYNGGWSSVIGLCLIAFGLLFLGFELDEYRAGRHEHAMVGVVLGIGSLAAGAVFFHAGHQAHVRAQRHRQSRDDTWIPHTGDRWRANVR
jgi:hypothetical protein